MGNLTDKPAKRGPAALRDWLARLWPGCCVACAAPATGDDLCPGCRADLQPNRICCPICALPLAEPALACGRCLRRRPVFDSARSPWHYAPPLDAMVLKLKFASDLAAARVLAGLWVATLTSAPPAGVDALIAIPLARDRLIERGYNQALELARPLAQSLRLPLLLDQLQRIRATNPQSGLSAKDRKRNLTGAFAAGPGVRGLRIALIDDVMTTGATMNAAAKALKQAGAIEVQAWALARA